MIKQETNYNANIQHRHENVDFVRAEKSDEFTLHSKVLIIGLMLLFLFDYLVLVFVPNILSTVL